MISVKISVLDHGYIELIECWGSDERIIEAARMSTNKGFQGWGPLLCPEKQSPGAVMHDPSCRRCGGTNRVPGDEKLLSYLYSRRHMTPFEMAGMTIEVQAPILVFREWHRHRTQSYNELSARYTPLPDVNYLPTVDRLLTIQIGNKQAVGIDGTELNSDIAKQWLKELDALYRQAQTVYEMGLNCGVPKELARLPVPVARYSRMRASANLRNWLGFLTLRMSDNAQWEIRQYANEVGRLIKERFPRTWELFIADQHG